MSVSRLIQMGTAGVSAGGGGGLVWADPDIANASQDATFDVSAQGTSHSGLNFNSDGTKMYATDASSNSIYQYDLSTAWDLSTASYNSVSFSVASQETQISDVTFNTDGSKMYIVGTGSDSVHQYSLSTNYDISTASYDNVSLYVQNQENSAEALVFKPDGSKLYIAGVIGQSIREYSLSTNFDLSTASYNSVTSSTIGTMYGIYFNSDGTKLFNVGVGRNVRQYSLTTGFDLSTISYDSILFSYNGIENNTTGVFFKPDGSKMYFIGRSNNRVYQYSVAAAVSSWTDPDIANASYDSKSFATTTQETAPYDLDFKPDGTSFIIVGQTSDTAYQYDCSTAWDISTASYANKSLNLSSQVTSPRGVQFNNDGTKIYVHGQINDAIYEYVLTTAYDVSSGSYNNVSLDLTTAVSAGTNFSGSQFYIPSGGSQNGTKLYAGCFNTDKIYSWTLSTAWDLSTASLDSANFSVLSFDAVHNGMYVNPDGTKWWFGARQSDKIYQFSMSTPYDISTSSKDTAELSWASQTTDIAGFKFKTDGSKLYAMSGGTDTIYQYST